MLGGQKGQYINQVITTTTGNLPGQQEKKIGYICRGQAYYWTGPKKGEPKFDVGTYYPMLGTVYSQEMYDADNGVKDADVQRTKKRRKRNKRPVEKTKQKQRRTAKS